MVFKLYSNRYIYLLFLYSGFTLSEENNEQIFVTFDFDIVDEVSLPRTQGGWPCFNKQHLMKWGVSTKALSEKKSNELDKCLLPTDLHSLGLKVNYNIKTSLLNFEIIEQIDLTLSPLLLPNNWDEGIPAILLAYQADYRRTDSNNSRFNKEKYNITFDYGVNYNSWRLRSQTIRDVDSYNKKSWRNSFFYLETDVRKIKSRVRVGDDNTPDSMFESFPYRGFSLASDDRMLPSSEQPKLNWVQGVAKTNAIVRIRQNGSVIYQTLVSPGSFTLIDIPLANQEDYITMSIKEEDGSETEQIIPHSRLQNLATKGEIKYSIISGHFHPSEREKLDSPAFLQSNITYGFIQNYTVYGGAILENNYHNYLIGAGRRAAGWGDFTLDYRRSTSYPTGNQSAVKGDVYRMRYGKSAISVNMNFNIEASYYPDNNYRSFENHIRNKSISPDDFWYDFYSEDRQRYNIQAQVNLSPSPLDNIYLTLERNTHRDDGGKDDSAILSYSKTLPYFDYTFSAQYAKYAQMKSDIRIGINFSIPLRAIGLPSMRVQTETRYENSKYQNGLTVRGRALEDSALSYSVSNTWLGNQQGNSDARLAYQYPAGEWQMTYRKGKEYNRYGLNVSGAAILHADGLTLGQRLGDTNALIYAPGMPYSPINEQMNIKTDANGYAIVPDITPYQLNSLSLTPLDELKSVRPEAQNVPTQGAVAQFTLMP